MNITALQEFSMQTRETLAKMAGVRDMLHIDYDKLVAAIKENSTAIDTFEKAKLFLQSLSETARYNAKVQIEEVVTNALQYVFGEHYSFQINLRNTNTGRPEADFLVVTKHGTRTIESNPTLGKGGGIVDLLAVALKFAILELLDFDGPIWMDEPFKHVSDNFIPATGKLLTFMGETSGRQIIIITHDPALAAMCPRNIRIVQTKGSSKAIIT